MLLGSQEEDKSCYFNISVLEKHNFPSGLKMLRSFKECVVFDSIKVYYGAKMHSKISF